MNPRLRLPASPLGRTIGLILVSVSLGFSGIFAKVSKIQINRWESETFVFPKEPFKFFILFLQLFPCWSVRTACGRRRGRCTMLRMLQILHGVNVNVGVFLGIIGRDSFKFLEKAGCKR